MFFFASTLDPNIISGDYGLIVNVLFAGQKDSLGKHPCSTSSVDLCCFHRGIANEGIVLQLGVKKSQLPIYFRPFMGLISLYNDPKMPTLYIIRPKKNTENLHFLPRNNSLDLWAKNLGGRQDLAAGLSF